MKISYFILVFKLLFSVYGYTQTIEKTYTDINIKSIYNQTDGRLNGKYISYYKNGVKKSEGKFENNLRTDRWIVWDSLGNIRMERMYSDPFTFKRIIPVLPKDKPIQLLNIPRYNIEYNSEGFIPYAYVIECDVHYHKRIWRLLTKEDNPILFGKNRLYKILIKNVLDSTIKAYSPKDDEFTEGFIPDLEMKYEVIGFKIKEDFFFDMNRLVSESRIMGICPIVKKQNGDTVDAFWVYFPEIRKLLAQYKLDSFDVPEKISSLDDLFFYRYFYGKVVKQSNVYDSKRIPDFSDSKVSESIDIELIEKEHDIWISLTKSPNQ